MLCGYPLGCCCCQLPTYDPALKCNAKREATFKFEETKQAEQVLPPKAVILDIPGEKEADRRRMQNNPLLKNFILSYGYH